MKILNLEDAKTVANICIEKLVTQKNMVYFSVLVLQDYSASCCFFSPVTASRKDKQKMVFVDDIEKIVRLLLSHPKISDLEYDLKENMITASFQDVGENQNE